MTRIIVIIIFLASSLSLSGKYGWYKLNSGTDKFIYDVFFADRYNGWAVGDEGLILRTTDGGETWDDQYSNVGSWLLSVHFIDKWEGWTVGDFGRLRHTFDGGETWEIQYPDVYPKSLNSVFFVDENLGWATGEPGVIHTSDGGESWTSQASASFNASKSVFFVNRRVGCAVGLNGTIIKTTDGGETWEEQNSGIDGTIFDVHFVNLSEGWAVSRHEPKILKTTDGGETWRGIEVGIYGFFKSVQFIDSKQGWAAGPGGIIYTDDGGETWRRQLTGARYNLWSLNVVDSLHAWAVGGDGTILKTDNGGFKFKVDFEANVTEGFAPLSTTFTDLTVGAPTRWRWDFGDGATDTAQNPIHTYEEPGNYSVSLTVYDDLDSSRRTKSNYVLVNDPNPLIADFAADTTVGEAPLTVNFQDLSGGDPESRFWDFGDGATHSAQNPVHIYQNSGTYTVSLTVSKQGEQDEEIKEDYIWVKEPDAVEEVNGDLPLSLFRISPNPSDGKTAIEFYLDYPGLVKISVYDTKGGKIKTILNKRLNPGAYVRYWNGINKNGDRVAGGFYSVNLSLSCAKGKFVESEFILIIK